jgi:tetratricopeptide (TPR) repeat protein
MITMDVAERLIHASRPPRGLHGSRMVLLGFGLLLGATLARPEILAQIGLPGWVWGHIALLVVLTAILWVGLRQRTQARLLLAAFEGLQLQEWDKARDTLLRLLARPVRHAPARAEALIGLGGLAEIEHNYDVAQRVYESILQEAAANPVQLVMARMALSAALLRTGQTADAVEMIDRLGRTSLPNSMKAHVELVTLFREVVMGQAADTIDKADHRRGLFREHLGTRAAYGYALLAAAYDRAGRPEIARQFWQDATLLIPAKTLMERFRELAPLATRYPATEHPW